MQLALAATSGGITDPLRAIPTYEDQLLFFGMAYMLLLFICITIFLVGVLCLYDGAKNKNREDVRDGLFYILLGMVLNGIHVSFGDIRPYLTETSSHAINVVQKIVLSLASILYNLLHWIPYDILRIGIVVFIVVPFLGIIIAVIFGIGQDILSRRKQARKEQAAREKEMKESVDSIKNALSSMAENTDIEKKTAERTKLSIDNECNTADIAHDLREYKSLLDDGILTQEEFDKKKQELLNLVKLDDPTEENNPIAASSPRLRLVKLDDPAEANNTVEAKTPSEEAPGFEKMTVAELKEFAKKHDITIPSNARKAKIVAILQKNPELDEAMPDFEKMTVAALRDYAKDHDIKLPSRARKAEIVEILMKKEESI